MSKLQYRGWIPVVSGNLSFREIGSTKFIDKFSCHNVVDQNGVQTIAFFGDKISNDGWMCSFLRRHLELFETKFYFGFIGVSHDDKATKYNNRDEIKGVGYYTFDKLHHEQVESLFQEEGANEAIEFVKRNQLGFHTKAEISIKRNGQCTVTPIDENADSDAIKRFNQLFFIIKDACHHHYHHDQKSDSITELHLLDSDDCDRWKFETLYALQRSIVSARRFKSERSLSRALGIATYASAFEKCFMQKKDTAQLKYNSEEALQSVNILINEQKKHASDATINIGLGISAFAAAFALSIGLHQISPFSDLTKFPFEKITQDSLGIAAKKPLLVSTLFATIVTIMQMVLGRTIPIFGSLDDMAGDFVGRLSFFNKPLQAFLWMLLGFLLSYIAYGYMRDLLVG